MISKDANSVITSLTGLHHVILKHKKLLLRILLLPVLLTLLGVPLLELRRQNTCDELHLNDMLVRLVSLPGIPTYQLMGMSF